MGRVVSISRAKAEFLALADTVASSGEEVVVTRRGEPLVRVIPFERPRTLAGSVTFLVDEDELIYGSLGEWDVERA